MLGIPSAQHSHHALTDLDCIVGFILGLGPRIFPMLLRFCGGGTKQNHLELQGLSSAPSQCTARRKSHCQAATGVNPFEGLS